MVFIKSECRHKRTTLLIIPYDSDNVFEFNDTAIEVRLMLRMKQATR